MARKQECSVAVEGMTCASCAMLIEMHLKRDPQVAKASVNFAAGTATVQGQLSREALFRPRRAARLRAAADGHPGAAAPAGGARARAPGRIEAALPAGRLADGAGDGSPAC
jgi:copper chaperone CopZ